MLGPSKVSLECSLIGLFEWYSEGVKEQTLLGLKGNIKEGDKLWTTVFYILNPFLIV